MAESYANALLTVLGIFLLFGLVFVLPLLGKGIAYRSATLFAGLNAGILTASLALDVWARTGGVDQDGFNKFLLNTLPAFYIASLIVGVAAIPRYVLSAPNQARAVISGLIGTIAYYYLALVIVSLIDFTYYAHLNSSLPPGAAPDLAIEFLIWIVRPNRFFTTVMIVSALVSMVGTTTIIQRTNDLDP